MTLDKREENNDWTGMEVAVIGMSGRFPGARNIDEFWENLKNSVEAISFFTDEELRASGIDEQLLQNPNYVKAKGVLEDIEYFDAGFFDYTPGEAELMDPQLRIFHECAWQALEDAGYVPRTYKGPIGLYVGAAASIPWIAYSILVADSPSQQFAVRALNENFSFSTRISYTLDLKGPSVTLHSACSSSLLAIHLACQGLLSGECDMALAGGVLVALPQKCGYLYQEGMIRSPDGHCRAFDAAAKGIVAGDGAAALVLKRLEDALHDRDHIYAVVKDSAANNDGRRKVGYTAPSIDGQVEVLRAAYQRAEVEPETIGYLEAHGTGTHLGDPLEIKALKLAFDSEKRGFCALGSVKTNVGHLDAAAGVTGFIKAVLALKHRLLPPSLHVHTPNPAVDFDNSPFYLINQPGPWQPHLPGIPLRAGVSSFGIGGTNVHVILEEAPDKVRGTSRGARGALVYGDIPGVRAPQAESLASREYQLILLSAKTGPALERMREQLARYLTKHPEVNLADAAYTLLVGRESFNQRGMVLCSDPAEAVRKLSSSDARDFHTAVTYEESRPVVFMFPGQGAQYVNMGLELYQKERVFRQEMDRCFEILTPLIGCDLKEILYPHQPGHKVSSPDIHQTFISQPVIFAFEYSLAKLLMHWGIKPDAMIGYSFGEYAAACLAGVFSLEDALTLVALRGGLMQRMPRGIMLSVPLPEEQLIPWLDEGISLAVVNGPSCIVSGSEEAIAAFEQKMKDKKYLCIRVNISVACHSKVLDSILKEFEDRVKQIPLGKPHIPFVSCVTGKWLTDSEAASPGYWTDHLRRTVRFVQGAQELLKKENPIFIELGPGIDLSTLIRRQLDAETNHLIVNLVRHPQKKASDQYFLLNKIGQLWLCGQEIDWAAFYADEERYRIPLPTYPFERQRWGVEKFKGDPFKLGSEILAKKSLTGKKPDIADWFYLPSWKRTMIPSIHLPRRQPSHLLVFVDDFGLGLRLSGRLGQKNQNVILVRPAEGFSRLNDQEYTIQPARSSDYQALFYRLQTGRNTPVNIEILHMWTISGSARRTADIDGARKMGLHSLLYLAKAAGNLGSGSEMKLVLVADHLHEVTGRETLEPEKSPMLGLLKVIPQEYPFIRCQSIDIELPEPGTPGEKMLLDQLEADFYGPAFDTVAAFRGDYRWVQTFEPVRLQEVPRDIPILPRLKRRGVYLITGGLGNIGLTLARYLAESVQARLVLSQRSPFPPRAEWDDWLSSHGEKDPISIKIDKIKELERLGAEVLVFGVDAADLKAMAQVLCQAETRFGPINGVIHAAGLVQGKSFDTINHLEPGHFDQQFQPKVYGLLVLEKLLGSRQLDFCLLISSLSPILGGLGLAAYASANQFMDTFVYQHNRQNSSQWTSLNWGDWQKEEEREWTMTPAEGIETFRRILCRSRSSQVVVSAGDLQTRIDQWVKLETLRPQDKIGKDRDEPPRYQYRPRLANAYVPPRNKLEERITHLWQQLFGFEGIGIRDDFFELGGDSLRAITLAARLHKELEVKIPLAEIFQESTIENMAILIAQGHPRQKGIYDDIQPQEKKEYYHLSSAQKRLYVLQQMDPENIAYNEFAVFRLYGNPDFAKFEEIFSRLVQRHGSFRTSIQIISADPVQLVHDQVGFKIEYYSLEHGTGSAEAGGELHCSGSNERAQHPVPDMMKSFIRPFDLSQAPLVRVGLINITEDDHILILEQHHVVTDAVSMGILIQEFTLLYEDKELPSLKIQYKDYSQWQMSRCGSEEMEKQEAYWLAEYSGEMPVLHLPGDYPRPAVHSFAGGQVNFRIDGQESQALKELARKQEATLFMVLLAVYNIFLAKLSSQEDIVVGTPTAGRRYVEFEYIMGMFVNTLALRNHPQGDKSFVDFLGEIKERTLAAFENQDYQYEELVERLSARLTRDTSRNPLFETLLVVQNVAIPEVSISGLKLEPFGGEKWITKFDLTLQARELDGQLHFFFEFASEIFKRETITRFVHYFKRIARAVTEAPHQKISGIDMLDDREKQQLLQDFNDTQKPYPANKLIHKLFADQVEKTPAHTAIIGRGQGVRGYVFLSYCELNERADWLAWMLIGKGVKPDTIVALVMERSVDMVIALLGILKSGGAYLPIEPGYPQERIDYMLSDSQAEILLFSRDLGGKFQSRGRFKTFPYIELIADSRGERRKLSHLHLAPPPTTGLAYIIYTSGSTGKPRGVLIEHHSVINRLTWMQAAYPIGSNDVILQKTSVVFDVSVWELFWWSLQGATLGLLKPGDEKDPQAIIEAVHKFSVTTMHFVPSMLNAFLDHLETHEESLSKLESLRQVFSSGESLGAAQVKRFYWLFKGGDSTRLINLYGPTEATVDVSCFECPAGEELEIVPIGKPIDNIRL